MHPTMSQMLVRDRHATLLAEAEAVRLVSLARSRSATGPAAPSHRDRGRLASLRRVVHRLVPA